MLAQLCFSVREVEEMLIGIRVGAMTIDRLLVSIRLVDEFDATTSKNLKNFKIIAIKKLLFQVTL